MTNERLNGFKFLFLVTIACWFVVGVEELVQARKDAAKFLAGAGTSLQQVADETHALRVNAALTLARTNLVLDNANEEMNERKVLVRAQGEALRNTGRKVDAALDSFDELLRHTRQDVDGAALDSHRLAQDTAATLTLVQGAVFDLDNAAKTLDRVVGDPAIPASLGNIQVATAQIAETSKHVEAATADVQQSLHKQLHPSKLRLGLGLLWTVVKVAATRLP